MNQKDIITKIQFRSIFNGIPIPRPHNSRSYFNSIVIKFSNRTEALTQNEGIALIRAGLVHYEGDGLMPTTLFQFYLRAICSDMYSIIQDTKKLISEIEREGDSEAWKNIDETLKSF